LLSFILIDFVSLLKAIHIFWLKMELPSGQSKSLFPINT